MSKMAERETWQKPESGWGTYQDFFDKWYDKAEARLIDKCGAENLSDDDRIGGACKIAMDETLKKIREDGFIPLSEDGNIWSVK